MTIDNRVAQWSGAAMMVGSLLFLLNKLDEMSRVFLSRRMPDVITGENTLLVVIGQLAFIIGYVGFWQLYSVRVERNGKRALRLFCAGGILVALGHGTFMSVLPASAEYLFAFVLVGLLLLVVGLLWFGILNWRRPVLAHWQWLPTVTALMGFAGFMLVGSEGSSAVFLVFRTLFALGLLGLGVTMWLEAQSVHPPVTGQTR